MTQAVEVKKEETIISGIWKFHGLPVEEVGKVAKELLANEPSAYRSMQVRKCSKSQYGICFVYDCGANAHDKTIYDEFFDRMTDILKRKFGNDFVGWDVTNEVWTLSVQANSAMPVRPEKWPPIDRGTEVMTTEPNMVMRAEWTDEGWAKRQWGIRGKIIVHHDSHGLCYEVQHPDGTIGCYDPSEFKVVS